MKTPPALYALALLTLASFPLGATPPDASSPKPLPSWAKWPAADEKWSAWDELHFKDTEGKEHALICSHKSFTDKSAKVIHLYTLQLPAKEQVLYGKKSSWNAEGPCMAYETKISQFAYDPAQNKVIDPRAPTKGLSFTVGSMFPVQGGTVRILQPKARDNDAPGKRPNPQPKPKPNPGPQAKSATDLFDDPVEKAVVRYLLDKNPDRDQATKDENALVAALKAPDSEAKAALIRSWQDKVVGKVNEQEQVAVDNPAQFQQFLTDTKLADPQLQDYVKKHICGKASVQAAVNVYKGKAMNEANAALANSKAGATAGSAEDIKAAADSAFTPTQAVVKLCAGPNEPPVTPPQPQGGGDTNTQPNLKPAGSDLDNKGGPPTPGKDKAKSKFLDIDDQEKRDAAAFGIMTGGVFGLLAMGAAAGPAGIMGMAVMGAVCGFLFHALKHSKKNDDG